METKEGAGKTGHREESSRDGQDKMKRGRKEHALEPLPLVRHGTCH